MVSACLPGVWGVYNKKRVYPHLFTVEVAPAANGKGCINDMRRLADRYASLIEIETKRKEEAYRQAQEEWELKKTTAHRKGKAVQIAEAPLKESTCYFLIPTQITKAKLLVHLADNGETGGLMADSEIDTLISASRQDPGQFDDLLRKAFHHEPVASSRKTDNEMIRIPRPRLAVLLAGTPGQFPRLIPDTENGLVSRLLMTQLQVNTETPELSCPDNFRKIFESLPEQFTLSDLYPLCQSAGIGERAVRRYLSRLQPAFITRLSRGVYRKTEGMP